MGRKKDRKRQQIVDCYIDFKYAFTVLIHSVAPAQLLAAIELEDEEFQSAFIQLAAALANRRAEKGNRNVH